MSCRIPRFFAVLSFMVASAVAISPATGDEWLAYLGGGLEEVEGGWVERDGLVLFTLRGGTLVSVPFHEVDLPTSAFITWQLGGRRRAPPRAELPKAAAETEIEPAPECVGARVLAVVDGETLQVATGEGRETIHLACLDTPETEHRFAELRWFGRAALSAVQIEVKPGAEVCLTELELPQRDEEGHRIVFVTLADGRDYTEGVIAGGLGLLRPGRCSRAAHYRQLENRAIAEQRGLWGPMSQRAAFAAVNFTPTGPGGPIGSQRPRGGG